MLACRNRAIARCSSRAILMGSLPAVPNQAAHSRALVPTGVVALVRDQTRARRAGQTLGAATILLALGGCSWVSGTFGEDDGPPKEEVSVFDVTIGQCFAPQQEVQRELATLTAVPCDGPHRQESFAIVDYQPPEGVQGNAFPGTATLAQFADAKCAQDFQDYVGISYLDSSLFFTYLMPSARGWEQDTDRAVVCFVTTTGAELTASVKESRL